MNYCFRWHSRKFRYSHHKWWCGQSIFRTQKFRSTWHWKTKRNEGTTPDYTFR